jgi:ABC-type dipeptide/oligopeptide/nickel transport system permease subunit
MPRSAIAGAILVLALVALAIVGPFVTRSPTDPDLDGGLSALGAPLPPGDARLLGTDPLGRDPSRG